MSSDNQREYYVYAYMRADGTPYYIGKGKKRRAWSKRHSVNLPVDHDRIVILEDNLTSEESLVLERALIKKHGRKDLKTGILHNKTDGGDGIVNPSMELRKKISTRMLGDNNPSRQPGASKKISETQLRPEVAQAKREKLSGELAPHYGKRGKDHPRYGCRDTEFTKKLKSDSSLGKQKSKEHKEAIGKAHKGLKKPNSGWGNTNTKGRRWFNDGLKSYMLRIDDSRAAHLETGRVKNVK